MPALTRLLMLLLIIPVLAACAPTQAGMDRAMPTYQRGVSDTTRDIVHGTLTSGLRR